MRALPHTLAVLAAALIAVSSFGQTKRLAPLMTGDSAPSIKVEKWIKGDAVNSFEKGKVYVVEFWATWCGPCKQSIPHLTELHKQFGDKVTFVGVSSFENNWDGVAPFVQSEGDKMVYDVATDQHAPKDRAGYMAKNWMIASHQPGIPTAFIVDKDSKIAWIGHPMNLEKPLGQVVDGTWDRDKAAKEYADDLQKQEDQTAALKQIQEDQKAKNWSKALSDLDAASKDFDPDEVDSIRLSIFTMSGDDKAYSKLATQMMDGPNGQQPAFLNELAWPIVDPKSTFTHRDADLAKTAMEKAVQIDGRKDGNMLDTLAWAYHWLGQDQKAIETEKEALTKGLDKSNFDSSMAVFQPSKH